MSHSYLWIVVITCHQLLLQKIARASFSNIMEAETVQNMDKGEWGGSGESDESSNDGSFRGSDEHRHRRIESKRSSKGALAPANWKSSNKVGPFGVVSDCLVNENKVKMVKLKVGGVTRTIQAKSSSDGASAVGPSSVKSSRISDTHRPRQKLILQEDSDDNPSLSSDKGSGLQGVPRKDTSKSVAHVGKAEEPVARVNGSLRDASWMQLMMMMTWKFDTLKNSKHLRSPQIILQSTMRMRKGKPERKGRFQR